MKASFFSAACLCVLSLTGALPAERIESAADDLPVVAKQASSAPGLILNNNSNSNDNYNALQAFLSLSILSQMFGSQFGAQNQFQFPFFFPALPLGAAKPGTPPSASGPAGSILPALPATLTTPTAQDQSADKSFGLGSFGTSAVINNNSNRNSNYDYLFASLYSSIYDLMSGFQSGSQSQTQLGKAAPSTTTTQ